MPRTEQERLDRIAEIIENVDNRCMAYDGPVGQTLDEMRSDEIEQIYKLAKGESDKLDPDWERAKEHFDKVRQRYMDLEGTPGINTTIALRTVFDPLAKRYNSGERTGELFTEMMNVE